jgi:hypothetical protein
MRCGKSWQPIRLISIRFRKRVTISCNILPNEGKLSLVDDGQLEARKNSVEFQSSEFTTKFHKNQQPRLGDPPRENGFVGNGWKLKGAAFHAPKLGSTGGLRRETAQTGCKARC